MLDLKIRKDRKKYSSNKDLRNRETKNNVGKRFLFQLEV